MASLLQLSNELLYKICFFADCEDLIRFSMVNTRLYLVSKPILLSHRVLWKKFHRIEEEVGDNDWFWHHLTRCLLTTSPGAPFIRHIKMGTDYANDEQPSRIYVRDWDIESDSIKVFPIQRGHALRSVRGQFQRPGLVNGTAEILTDGIKASTWASEGKQALMKAGVRKPSLRIIPALLLPLLPNLHSLRLSCSSGADCEVLETAVRCAALSHSQGNSCCQAFANLASFGLVENPEMKLMGAQIWARHSLRLVASFMALPKMRKVSASGISSNDFSRDPMLPCSNALEVTFLDSDISAGALEELLAGGPSLQRFCLEISSMPEFFDEQRLGRIVLLNARDSLKELGLTRVDELGAVRVGDEHGLHLSDFTRLEEINLHWDFVHFPPGAGTVFPPALEKLGLFAHRYPDELPRQVNRILEAKQRWFPALAQLTVGSWLDHHHQATLAQISAEKGVTWIHPSREDHAWRERGARGLPRRDIPRLTGPPR